MIHTNTIRALPLVASMLGDRLGVKVDIGNRENACTDGNTIYIPALPADGDERLYSLVSSFIDHESAHIRFTDFQVLDNANMSPLEKHIWNSIEDWRIEHELVKRYPGCREHFEWLIRYIFKAESKEKAGDNPPAFSILNYILLTLRSWDVPELKKDREEEALVIENHWPGLQGKLDNILNQLPGNCHSTGDSIEYAQKIVNLLEKEADADSGSEPQSPEQIADTTVQEESHDKGRSNLHEETEEQASSPAVEGSERERQGDSASTRKEHELSASAGKLHTLIHAREGELPASFDEQLASELNATRTGTQNSGVRMAVEGQLEIHPLPENQRQESLSASRALRTRLQALMQARTLRRTAPGRYGRLDGRLLHRLSVQNPRGFLRREEVPGVNTAVHILLDISGSMYRRIHLATSACYAVASALSGIPGINVGVTAFPATTPNDIPGVCPLVRHGERVGTGFDVSAAGATPLAEALWWIAKVMLYHKENRKILLLITDGFPDNSQKALEALHMLQNLGTEVMGIAIQSPELARLLPIQANIDNMNDLAGAMFNILGSSLIHNKGMNT